MKLLLILLIPFTLFAGEPCETLAAAPNYYQETEWYWFKGQAVDTDLKRGIIKARGMALEKIFDKCEGIHKNAKIFHQCHRRLGGAQEVFVLASIFRKDCSAIKYSKGEDVTNLTNHKLVKDMRVFFDIIKDHKDKNLSCTPEKGENCLKVGTYLFDMAQFLKALVPLEYSCEDGVIQACILGGIGNFILKEENAALTLFRKACRKDDSTGCLLLGISLNRIQKYNLARKKFLKSCHLGNSRGCLFLGEWDSFHKNENLALKSFYNSCRMDYSEGCRQSYELLRRKGWGIDHPFSHKACLLGDGEVCLYRGLDELAERNNQKAVQFLNRSCMLGIGDGCFNLALFLGEKYKERSLEFYKAGCNLGNIPACLELEKYFEKDQTLKTTYKMYSCQLGVETSCFEWGQHAIKNNQISMGKNIIRRSCERGFTKACLLLKTF